MFCSYKRHKYVLQPSLEGNCQSVITKELATLTDLPKVHLQALNNVDKYFFQRYPIEGCKASMPISLWKRCQGGLHRRRMKTSFLKQT